MSNLSNFLNMGGEIIIKKQKQKNIVFGQVDIGGQTYITYARPFANTVDLNLKLPEIARGAVAGYEKKKQELSDV